jgi:uncharacterized membrane protein YdcZ (DUF606 family)
MLILAFGFLALCTALEYRARDDGMPRLDPRGDRVWKRLAGLCGILAIFGPLVVMARVGLAQGAAAYLTGVLFALVGGFLPPRLLTTVSPAAGVFGLGLLIGALIR